MQRACVKLSELAAQLSRSHCMRAAQGSTRVATRCGAMQQTAILNKDFMTDVIVFSSTLLR
eukprot:4064-Heterococcus_DN1.PRE.1